MAEIVNERGRLTIVRNKHGTFNVEVDQFGAYELHCAEVTISQEDLCKFLVSAVGQLILGRAEMLAFVIKMAETAREASDG